MPHTTNAMNKFELKHHIEHRINAATADNSPFPHIIVEDFFPPDIYEMILRENPFKLNQGKEWISQKKSKKSKTNTPYFARKQINFHTGDAYETTPEGKELWDSLSECFLADDWFPKLIAKKFPEYFSIRFGDLMKRDDFASFFRRELFLQRHEPGYYIGPHTDIPTRVFTCIFSFADRAGFETFGTELCSPSDPLVRCWGNNHYKPDDFIVEKLAPYKPNNFLLFFKTRQSFHSVKAIDDTVPNQRYGMQFQFYEPKGGLFRDLSAPDLMSIRHKKPKFSIERLNSLFCRSPGE